MRGKDIFVFDETGRDYIEAVSCFYCASLGFSDEDLIEAAVRQLRTLPVYPSAIHRTVPAIMELTERLAAISPVKNPRIYFATTGSEANDYLIKFMWYGNGFAGEPDRRKLISRKASYHGSTIATAALGGSSELHQSFGIPMGFSVQISHPSWPNDAHPGESEDQFCDRLVVELEEAIVQAGPETIGAMIAEPVSVSSGMFPPRAAISRRSRLYCAATASSSSATRSSPASAAPAKCGRARPWASSPTASPAPRGSPAPTCPSPASSWARR